MHDVHVRVGVEAVAAGSGILSSARVAVVHSIRRRLGRSVARMFVALIAPTKIKLHVPLRIKPGSPGVASPIRDLGFIRRSGVAYCNG